MSRNRFLVEGLAGRQMLGGEIPVRGAKNAVIKSFAAALLFEGPLALENVPHIEDVSRMAELLGALGARAERRDGGYVIDTSAAAGTELDDALARTLRASIVLSGAMLARFGRASFPHPGGDVIGPRPINLFLEGFQKLGARVSLKGDRYLLEAPAGLRGAEFFFTYVSVTATETLMMAAVLAKGTTVLKNAAMEPEIAALAEFLNASGARISGAGTPTITVEGGGMLRARGPWRTMPDRIEAGSFVLLGALAARELTVTECEPAHCEMLVGLLRESGIDIAVGERSITVRGGEPRPLAIRTHEYPGFATDLQPPMVVYLTQARGESTVFETIWGGRLGYTAELVRMGADITVWNPQQLTIKGPAPLRAAQLASPDIRAGLAYLMAAAMAEGQSAIDNVYHIDRGYERIEERLQKIGLNIRREQV